MKRSIRDFNKIFNKSRELFDRYVSRTLALFCAFSFAICVYLLFRSPTSIDELFQNHATCGNTKALARGPARFDQDVLSLRVGRDEGFRKFVLSGTLEVSRKSYLKHFKNAKGILVSLYTVPASTPVLVPFPLWMRIKALENREEVADQQVIIFELKKEELFVSSNSRWFPFEDYRVGFSASVHTLQPSAKSYRKQTMDVTIVNATLSNDFVVRQAKTMRDFIWEPEKAAALRNVDKEYSVDTCALVISRPLWYKTMVLFLVSLLFAPAVYIYYRRDADPGVELIAAILGIAAIRYYLLGDLNNWNFYYIDAAFGLAILLTAFIPLWRLRKRSDVNLSMK